MLYLRDRSVVLHILRWPSTKPSGQPNMKKSVTSKSSLPISLWLPVLVRRELGQDAWRENLSLDWWATGGASPLNTVCWLGSVTVRSGLLWLIF